MNYLKLKIILLTYILVGCINYGQAINARQHNFEASFYDHLCEVNKKWRDHAQYCPKGSTSFKSDIDRIQMHLELVVKVLRKNPPANLNSQQTQNRLFLIQKLEKYTRNRVFPQNTRHSKRQPYFVDKNGTHCAVGQLIEESGNSDLVKLISLEHNYDYIEDIDTYGLTEWTNKHGFTVEELKWIQPGYAPSDVIAPVLGGANGEVTELTYDPYNSSVLIAGKFTELDNFSCLNIGFYKNNQLSCFGNGVDGIINDVFSQSGTIYCFGELYNNGNTYPIAKFAENVWTYLEIPNRAGAICTAANNGGSGYQIEVAINHSLLFGKQEIWHLLNDNTWQKKAEVNGIVLDIIASSYGRVHTGHFDTISVFNSNGILDSNFSVHNVVIKQNYSNQWYGLGGEISDTVNVVKSVGGALIFGGTCGSQPGESDICLSRYYNGTLQALYNTSLGEDDYSIKAIAYNNSSSLIIGGIFEIFPLAGTYGNNLASYHLVNNTIEPLALFDQSVESLVYSGSDLYIGGEFGTNMSTYFLNHLGQFASTVNINELSSAVDLNIYPNPFKSTLNIDGLDGEVAYTILNANGKEIISGLLKDNTITGLNAFSAGVYYIKFETKEGVLIKKVVK